MSSEPNLSVKHNDINFDADFKGYGQGEGTCKQAFKQNLPVSFCHFIYVAYWLGQKYDIF